MMELGQLLKISGLKGNLDLKLIQKCKNQTVFNNYDNYQIIYIFD